MSNPETTVRRPVSSLENDASLDSKDAPIEVLPLNEAAEAGQREGGERNSERGDMTQALFDAATDSVTAETSGETSRGEWAALAEQRAA